MKANVTDLLVDTLKENDLWLSFVAVAERVYEKKLGAPLKELERIRHLDKETDTVFVERAIRQCGLELNSEFFEQNRERLTKSYYELIKFWEMDGNPNYPKFISFLLGRDFNEQVLYTNDESEMFPNHGKLLTQGGDWYSTSHVDISIEVIGLKQSLDLTVVQDDVKYIKQHLSYDQSDSDKKQQIDDLINQNLNKTLDVESELARALLERRILQVYYQFAPIEKVVRDIYFSLSSVAYLSLSASGIIRPSIYIDSSEPKVVDRKFIIPSKVQGFRKYSASVLLSLSDETQVSEVPQWIKGQHIKEFDGASIEFVDIDFVESIEFEYSIRGLRQKVNVELYPIGTPFVPDELQIVGPSRPKENTSNVYKLVTRHDNVREFADTDRVTWSIDTNKARFQDNKLVVSEIFEELDAQIKVEHKNTDGTTSVDTKNVVLVPYEKETVAKSIVIGLEQYKDEAWHQLDPQKDIVQGMKDIYLVAHVEYTDGSKQDLYSLPAYQKTGQDNLPIAEWYSSSSSTEIKDTGLINIPVVYRDFTAEYTVVFQENERRIKQTLPVLFKKPRLVIDSIEIVGPGSVLEKTRTVYQLLATWSNGMQSVVEAYWSSSETQNADSVDIENGLMVAPSINKASKSVNINASINVYRYDQEDNESVVRLATSKTVQVNKSVREINTLVLTTPSSLNQGNSNLLRVYGEWTNNTTTQLVPYRIELKHKGNIISKYVRNNEPEFEHLEGNPVILGTQDQMFFAKEEDSEFPQFKIDYLPSTEQDRLEPLSGLIDIVVYYINPLMVPQEGIVLDDETLRTTEVPINSDFTTFSVAPKIFLSEDIEIVYPPTMAESSRVFLTALVTYANGEIEQANAVWKVEPVYVDQEIEADLIQGSFDIERMVKILIGVDRAWLDSNTLSESMIEDLVDGDLIFKSYAEDPPEDWTQTIRALIDANQGKEFYRALLQTRTLEDGQQQEFKVSARYFQQDETVIIKSIADPVKPVDIILSSRIEGPGLISADQTIDFSYGLVVDYQDGGENYMVSNAWRIDVVNKAQVLSRLIASNDNYSTLLPTKDDLSLYDVEEMDQQQLDEVFESIAVAEIDNEGYVYPRINIDAQLIIYADYDDGITQFTRSLEVYMKTTNSVLKGMYVYNITNDGAFERNSNVTPSDSSGDSEIIRLEDIPHLAGNPDSFSQIDPASGKLFYRFKAKVEREDDLGLFYDPDTVEWSLDTATPNVALSQADRNIISLLVDPVDYDTQVTLNARYTEEFAAEPYATNPASAQDRIETVSTSLKFIIESSRAIDIIERQGNDYVYDDPDSVFYPSVRIKRRDGSYVDNPESLVTWYVQSGPAGIKQQDNGFIIPQLTQNSVMVLKAVATEGLQTISQEFEYALIMEFTPSDIDLVLPQEVQTALIDAGHYELQADLNGNTQQGPETRTATDSCFYYFNYNEQSASFEDNVLKVEPVEQDKTITVSIKSKDYPQFVQTRDIKIYSSFPLFGSYFEGIKDSASFNEYLNNLVRLHNRSAGTFTVNPDADQFGYFAHPKSLGLARITYIPEAESSQSLFGGWDGIQRDREGQGETQGPIEVTRVYEQGLEETWYLYRTNLRGFSRGKFAVRYVQE